MKKMGTTPAQKISVLEILSKLVYAPNNECCQHHYEQLKNTDLKSVINYFDQKA